MFDAAALNVDAVPGPPTCAVKLTVGDWSGVMVMLCGELGMPISPDHDNSVGGAWGWAGIVVVPSVGGADIPFELTGTTSSSVPASRILAFHGSWAGMAATTLWPSGDMAMESSGSLLEAGTHS